MFLINEEIPRRIRAYLVRHVDTFAHIGLAYMCTDLLFKYVPLDWYWPQYVWVGMLMTALILTKEILDYKISLKDILAGYLGYLIAAVTQL